MLQIEKSLSKCPKPTLLALLRCGGISLCRPRSDEQSSRVQASESWCSRSARGSAEAEVVLSSLIPELALEPGISPRHNTVQAQGLYPTTSAHPQGVTEHCYLQHLFVLRQLWPFPEAPRESIAALGRDVEGGCHGCRVVQAPLIYGLGHFALHVVGNEAPRGFVLPHSPFHSPGLALQVYRIQNPRAVARTLHQGKAPLKL